MPTNIYQFRFGSFDLMPSNGIYVADMSPQPSVKAAGAEVEGRSDGYLGSSYPGFIQITMVGKVIGDTYEDFEAKFDAFLAALMQTSPQLLYRKADEYWTAQVTTLPAKSVGNGVAWCDFTVQFRARPNT